ncbi:hypothetical protein Nepgr_021147 [Nepenthes gracilis]|uniref:Uncharacterized protein n=1 Tax=Nepenthes gracilis TaxID=150966 RepID=A0AAD3XX26_NEPGR|nr:hypothetical protein Nepgr_021147 [Nepenthes gracilis]
MFRSSVRFLALPGAASMVGRSGVPTTLPSTQYPPSSTLASLPLPKESHPWQAPTLHLDSGSLIPSLSVRARLSLSLIAG